jgi:hypothetical protein
MGISWVNAAGKSGSNQKLKWYTSHYFHYSQEVFLGCFNPRVIVSTAHETIYNDEEKGSIPINYPNVEKAKWLNSRFIKIAKVNIVGGFSLTIIRSLHRARVIPPRQDARTGSNL